jgi:hypothetical protein
MLSYVILARHMCTIVKAHRHMWTRIDGHLRRCHYCLDIRRTQITYMSWGLKGFGCMLQNWLEGQKDSAWFPYITDVRDIALAHVRAATLPDASGRYLVSIEEGVTPSKAVRILFEAFPQYNFVKPEENSKSFRFLDTSRVRHLTTCTCTHFSDQQLLVLRALERMMI